MQYLIFSKKHTRGDDEAWWWKPNRMGYTPNLDEAGRYDMAEAYKIHTESEGSFAIPEHKLDGLVKRRVLVLGDGDNMEEIKLLCGKGDFES